MKSSLNNIRKNENPLAEFEPPIKTGPSDAQLFIKNQVKKQTATKTSLNEELLKSKEFEKGPAIVSHQRFITGISSADDLKIVEAKCTEIGELNSLGLNSSDIDFYLESKNGLDFLKTKHKNLDKDQIKSKLHNIEECLAKLRQDKAATGNVRDKDTVLSTLEPDDEKEKVLKFTLDNEKKRKSIDFFNQGLTKELKSAEETIQNQVHLTNKIDIKKIRRRARRLKEKHFVNEQINETSNQHIGKKHISLVANSKWDLKHNPEESYSSFQKPKTYTCALSKNKNLYTIKDGQIIQINECPAVLPNCKEQGQTSKTKLSYEEIKSLPKFHNYDIGIQSTNLYIKNLPKRTTEADLKNMFEEFSSEILSSKVMTGRMAGQAFVYFKDKETASKALNKLNGTFLNQNPIVIEFGKQKTII